MNIVPGSGGSRNFQPAVIGGQPGNPLKAAQNDTVTWNNTTGQSATIYPTVGNQPDGAPDLTKSQMNANPRFPVSYPNGVSTIYYATAEQPIARGSLTVPNSQPFDWSVKIVSLQQGAAAFQPTVPRSKPGDSLVAQPNDIVSWGNETGQQHQPWPTAGNVPDGPPAATNDPNYQVLSDVIAPQQSSNPQFVVTSPMGATTIYYCCKLHPQERGSISIVYF